MDAETAVKYIRDNWPDERDSPEWEIADLIEQQAASVDYWQEECAKSHKAERQQAAEIKRLKAENLELSLFFNI